MTRDYGRLHRQGTFDLPGTQHDLFDHEVDSTDDPFQLIQAEEAAAWGDMALLSRNEAGEQNPVPWPTGNASNRLLMDAACAGLIALDRRSNFTTDARPNIAVEIAVNLSALGHVLVVTATLERSLRRFGAAYTEAERAGTNASGRDFGERVREILETSPQPLPIRSGGLRIDDVVVDDHRTAIFSLKDSGSPAPWLDRFPHFACAYAIASIVDHRATVSSSAGTTPLKLPPVRYKIIERGLQPGSVQLSVRRLGAKGVNEVTAQA